LRQTSLEAILAGKTDQALVLEQLGPLPKEWEEQRHMISGRKQCALD
jgi:hypothetical protein